MYIKRLICVLLSFVLGISVLPNAHAVDQDGAQAPPYSRQADIELAQQVESPDALTYEFTYLKQSISLWADGKGDLLLEQHVKNTSSSSSDVFDRITWYIGWPPSSISNISAKDSSGPLTVQEVVSGGGLQLTVIFRRPVPQNATYAFKLLVTIAGMVQGTGNNWLAAWSTSGGSNIKTFEHVLALPANANVTSISPPPTERRGNVITWRLVNQSSWSLTINVPYVLSDQITVPLLLQTSDPWRSDIYAYNTSPVDNIERWGCLMTSGAMIVNYLSQAQENPFRTNPRILNNVSSQ